MKLTDLFGTSTEIKTVENKTATNLTNQYNELLQGISYNRKRIFARARYIYSTTSLTWSESLTQSWSESKKVVLRKRNELNELSNRMISLYTPIQKHETKEAIAIDNYNTMLRASSVNNKFYL